MKMSSFSKLVSAISMMLVCCNLAWAVDYKIATASEKGTYFAIGADLAKFVAPQSDISLQVLPTAGSAANVKMLRYEPGVKFAVVQADVFQAFVDRGGGGGEAADIIRPLRVILPLYNTEIHYIVRADSPLNYLHDIKDAKINGGLVGSGAAVITDTMYRLMFKQPMPESNATFLSNEDALVKLVGDKSIDVVVVAAGQPAPLITGMKPEAQKFIKLLKFDPAHPSSAEALNIYSAATMRATSYPNLLTEDFTTVAVGAFLVTYDFNTAGTTNHMARFARALCENFPRLQTEGHPKWREVELAQPKLAKGWTYYPVTSRAINDCLAGKPLTIVKSAATKPVRQTKARAGKCSREDRLLGLCK